jgi:hypothetical protein
LYFCCILCRIFFFSFLGYFPREGKDEGNRVQTFSLFFIDSSILISFLPFFQILDKNF